jgi:hypothetical protein
MKSREWSMVVAAAFAAAVLTLPISGFAAEETNTDQSAKKSGKKIVKEEDDERESHSKAKASKPGKDDDDDDDDVDRGANARHHKSGHHQANAYSQRQRGYGQYPQAGHWEHRTQNQPWQGQSQHWAGASQQNNWQAGYNGGWGNSGYTQYQGYGWNNNCGCPRY